MAVRVAGESVLVALLVVADAEGAQITTGDEVEEGGEILRDTVRPYINTDQAFHLEDGR